MNAPFIRSILFKITINNNKLTIDNNKLTIDNNKLTIPI